MHTTSSRSRRRGLQTAVLAGVLFLAVAGTALAASTTTRVSLSTAGGQGNAGSIGGLISAAGSYVAFDSLASNLVPGDTNAKRDVFVRDLASGKTTRVSVSATGAQANGTSTVEAISPNGRYVLFSSGASNLVSGDTNGKWDVFLRDTLAHTTVRVSLGDHDAQLPAQSFGTSMTPNANLIVFTNTALRHGCHAECVLLRDRATGKTRRISGTGFQQGAFDGVISADGRYVAFTGDPELGPGYLYRRDLQTNSVVSRGNLNINDDTAISADGNRIVFDRQVENNGNFIVNTLIWQVTPNSLITVSHVTTPNTYGIVGGGISADGRYATYATNSPSEVAGDTNGAMDVFRRDTQTGTTIRISVTAGGGQLADPSVGGSMTSGGSMVVFTTLDGSVVAGDTNQHRDVFLRGALP